MRVELVDLERLVAESDFVTIHLPKTPETVGLIGADAAGQGQARRCGIVNVARGGIVDEDGAGRGHQRRAASPAPPSTCSPTSRPPSRRCSTSTRWSSRPTSAPRTREAQDKAGDTIAEQVLLALAGEFVPFAVNVAAAEASETVRPFLPLAERLGRLFAVAGRAACRPRSRSSYEGQLADYDTRILTLSVLKGLFGGVTDEPVTYVNAPQLAEERGIEVRDDDHVARPRLREPDHAAGRRPLAGRHPRRAAGRAPHRDGRRPHVDVPPAGHMLVVRNDDRPGMIGAGRHHPRRRRRSTSPTWTSAARPSAGSALMVLATTEPVPAPSCSKRCGPVPGIVGASRSGAEPTPGIVSAHPLRRAERRPEDRVGPRLAVMAPRRGRASAAWVTVVAPGRLGARAPARRW